MVHDTRPAFSNHRRAAGGAITPSGGEGLAALIVNHGVLQNRSILRNTPHLPLKLRGYMSKSFKTVPTPVRQPTNEQILEFVNRVAPRARPN